MAILTWPRLFTPSSNDAVASLWWEAEALELLRTTSLPKVEQICSLIPFSSPKKAIEVLKQRSDVHILYGEDDMVPPHCPLVIRARESTHPACLSPWDWDQQPLMKGSAEHIAAQLHRIVWRAICHVPPIDLIRKALGRQAPSVTSLFCGAQDVSDQFKRRLADFDKPKAIFIKVSKVSEQAISSQNEPVLTIADTEVKGTSNGVLDHCQRPWRLPRASV